MLTSNPTKEGISDAKELWKKVKVVAVGYYKLGMIQARGTTTGGANVTAGPYNEVIMIRVPGLEYHCPDVSLKLNQLDLNTLPELEEPKQLKSSTATNIKYEKTEDLRLQIGRTRQAHVPNEGLHCRRPD